MYYLDLLVLSMSVFMLIFSVLIGVAFLTLLERKVLGYIQIRKGPNKVGIFGILQPLGDAVKLFSKEQVKPIMSNYLIYYFSPVFNLFISLSLWLCIPYLTFMFHFSLSSMFFLCCSSLGVYSIMISGWSSNSNYSLLGSLRSVAQTISYEVSLVMILLSYFFLIGSLSIYDFIIYQNYVWFFFMCFPLSLMFYVSVLAETNRIPFDFAEGESELVSGFNVEYSAGGFSLIFISEYTSILFMSMFYSFIFLGGMILTFTFYLIVLFISFSILWVRGTLPRLRYDLLMYLTWKSFLPISLSCLMFFLSLKMFFYIFII
uniref:NADH-ubiquinone oxidoreductase chain 1 n=1 Tax=Lamprigera yunnana TaxID=370605 RepID=A0A5C0Q0A1_9COLE|nr:NADH dehydrogenase subunit 1 [Lamprigera yunnana]QEJ81512.1 NADH dehydrogenase subunit 1 [Lamprigera yunnana]